MLLALTGLGLAYAETRQLEDALAMYGGRQTSLQTIPR